MKIYHPTKEEFENPIHYIDKIFKEAAQYGCVKIMPPEDFKPPLAFDRDTNLKLNPIRYQVL
jgi:histone demethylase JARID1